jgi:2-polyprenyl-3-methyl-5-hydroxy-6-metoxy-1,4-benzoquinol methylase
MTDFKDFSHQSPGSPDVYRAYIENDPYRRGLHYPAVIAEIGEAYGKRILDAGTGDGQLPKLLAARGATVVGYDHNPNMIKKALSDDGATTVGVTFVAAKPQNFVSESKFDLATSVMVLNFATGIADLIAFFRCAQRHLVPGGRFISIVLNPLFSDFDKDFVVRRITRLEDNQVRMEFLDEKTRDVEQKAVMHQYSTEEYEQATRDGGMQPAGWKQLFAGPDAVRMKGEAFWHACHKYRPYAMFIARNH